MQALIFIAYIGKQIKFMFWFADPFWKRSLSEALHFILFKPATFFC
jgi:hypothetical protein